MRLLGLAQQIGDVALRRPRPDRHRHYRSSARELTRQRFEHACGDAGHSGENVDILHLDAGGT